MLYLECRRFKMKLHLTIVCSVALFLAACSVDQNQLVIKGKVEGASKEILYLSKMINQQIVLLDSVNLSSSGKFKFKSEIPSYPEFYFLNLDKSASLTLLSDSGQQIIVQTKADNFVDGSTITENKYSQKIQDFNKKMNILRSSVVDYKEKYAAADVEEKKILVKGMTDELNGFKMEVGKDIIAEVKSFYAYYMLYQRISDDYLLFDPYAKDDSKYFAAVANVLSMYYPEAPRTKALVSNVKQVMAAKRTQGLQEMIDNAPEGIPDMKKTDINGKERSLSGLKGKLVVLNYWAAANAGSREWNKVLKSIYSKYHPRGLEIYQYSADKSKLIWEDAVKKDGITWITVNDFEGESSDALWKYNVKKLPTTYLISREGKLLGVFESELKLRDAIKKNL